MDFTRLQPHRRPSPQAEAAPRGPDRQAGAFAFLLRLSYSADRLSRPQRKRRTEALGAIVAEVEKEKKLIAQEDKEDILARKERQEKEKEDLKLQKMTKAERIKYLVSVVLLSSAPKLTSLSRRSRRRLGRRRHSSS